MTTNNNTSEKTLLTISETSNKLDLPSHVLRFWEKQFPQIKPTRHNNRRYYTAQNIETIIKIKELLYTQGFTIEGAKKELKTPTNTQPPSSNFKNELLEIREKLQKISQKLENLEQL